MNSVFAKQTPLYRIKPSTRALRLALRLDPIERVFDLVVPHRCSLKKAQDFAGRYEAWMEEKLANLPPIVPFHHGHYIPLDGQKILLSIQKEPERKQTSIRYEHGNLIILTNKTDPTCRIKRWIKNFARDCLSQRSEEKAKLIAKTINSISVRETKSRWGSCSSDNNLSYSWRLIFAPPEAIDYVVAHEVAHLCHMDHSKDFWALCRELSDDFEEGKYWMKAHGAELMRYGGSAPNYSLSE